MATRRRGNADEPLPEYDFTNAVRGKYYERYSHGSNVVLLDPDVAAVFRDSRAVNDALRMLVSVADAKAGRARDRAHDRRPNRRLQPTASAKAKRRG
jgi:hypothetical protein